MYRINFYKPFLVLFLITFVVISSCRRNKDCELIVSVIDSSNAPVAGATVHVYPNQASTSGNLTIQDQTGITDASGYASFIFKLPAILRADVSPPAPYGSTYALVKLEEGKSVTKGIKVY